MGKKSTKSKKLSKKQFLNEVDLLLKKINANGNESMLYLEEHWKWLMDNVDENNDEMWGVFNVFLYHQANLLDDIRGFGNTLSNPYEIKKLKNYKELVAKH